MKTQDARWMRIRDLFEHAIELAPEERDAYVDSSCGTDLVLRDELKSLLAADIGQNNSPLTGAIGAAVEATTRDRRQELLGSTIGPYRLTSVLGHGGAGTVYLGERVDRQYSAQVAIKVVEGAAAHADIGRRFRAERQILASLNHPHIARLIDAGETPQGYPYLVMEYVHGESIDKYCDRMELSLDDRVKLVLKVCTAVQYAHQNLVVHRDLKPGNILVTPDGTPKLLDFGIAKLLDTSAEAAELALTRMNDRVLTPEYASPEQILGQTITTSSDVYALGVVTYELLTGLRPYTISSTSQLELERTICIVDPTKPSTAVKQALANAASDPPPTRNIHTIAEARHLTPMRLRSYLDGDLDSILLRALRKEPTLRYNSIEQFASDLRRHLAREPVHARQGNWVYYAQRFARRHAIGVATTAGIIALITTALIVVSVQSKRIAHERDLANQEKQTSEAVAGFMVNVFAAADPFTVQDKQITASELLDKSTQSIRGEFDQQPAVKARLLEAMGRTYSRQGQSDRGAALIEEALTLRTKLEGASNPALASTLVSLAKARLNSADYSSAEKPLRDAISILERANQTHSADYAYALFRLAELETQRGNLQQTFALYERTITLFKEIFGPKNSETAMVLTSYGTAKMWSSDYLGAEQLARESVEIYRTTKAATDPDRISAESLLGISLLYLGNLKDAEPLLKQSYITSKLVFGNRSIRIKKRLQDLVDLYERKGDLPAAERYAHEALAICLSLMGERNYETAQSRETLAIVEWKRGKSRDAERELRLALNVYHETLPPDHLFITASEHYLAEVLLTEKRPAEAIVQLETTLARLQRLHAVPSRIARSENTLGQALVEVGKIDEGEKYLERSYQVLRDTTGVAPDTLYLAHDRIEKLYALRGEQSKLAALSVREKH